MPYIPRIASITAKGDNGGAGPKKAGLARGGFPRIPHNLFLRQVPNRVPQAFTMNMYGGGRSGRSRNLTMI
jgi:hypothetical protein